MSIVSVCQDSGGHVAQGPRLGAQVMDGASFRGDPAHACSLINRMLELPPSMQNFCPPSSQDNLSLTAWTAVLEFRVEGPTLKIPNP